MQWTVAKLHTIWFNHMHIKITTFNIKAMEFWPFKNYNAPMQMYVWYNGSKWLRKSCSRSSCRDQTRAAEQWITQKIDFIQASIQPCNHNLRTQRRCSFAFLPLTFFFSFSPLQNNWITALGQNFGALSTRTANSALDLTHSITWISTY